MPVGDPNGIGPEIALMSAISADILQVLKPVIVADPTVIEVTAGRLGLEDRLLALLAEGSVALSPVAALERAPEPGAVTAEAGAAAVAYARAAIRLVESREAQAVVAGPHNETAIARAGIPFAGYPQLLAETTGIDPDDVFLMLIGPRFRIVHATLHIGLRQALDSLTPEKVLSALRAAHGALRLIGIDRPRIAVCGINPHAGEGGLFGNEDAEITAPAVALANATKASPPTGRGAPIFCCRNANTTPTSPCITTRATSRSSWKGGAMRSASRSARRCCSAPSPMAAPTISPARAAPIRRPSPLH